MPLDPAVDAERTGSASSRCPSCGGAVRPDAPWCTQCWLDLRAPVVPPPVPPDVVAHAAPVGGAGASWPCPCGASNDLAQDACAVCGAQLFDALRETGEPALSLPVLGDVAGLSKVQLGIAALVVLAGLLAALLAVLALAGALLT